MLTPHHDTAPASGPAQPDALANASRGWRRVAWLPIAISLFAQVVGAAAVVGLALLVVERSFTPASAPDLASLALASDGPRAGVPADGGRASIAVLPLATFGDASEYPTFSGSLTQLIVTRLAGVDGLRVVPSAAAPRSASEHVALPQIASELGVRYLLQGSVAVVGARARITAQLIDTSSAEHVWARSYDEPLEDLLAVEGRLAQLITDEVKKQLVAEPPSRSPSPAPQPAPRRKSARTPVA